MTVSSLGSNARPWHTWALAGIMAVGAALRFHALGRDGMWADECASMLWATLPLNDLWHRLNNDTQAPLHFLVERVLLPLLGQDEWGGRAISALAGTASIWLMWRVGSNLVDRKTGLWAALLLATQPLHVAYSRETRSYALMMLGVLLALWGLVALREKPNVTRGVLAGLALLVPIYSHNLAFILLAGLGVATLLSWWRTRPSAVEAKAHVVAGAVVVLGYLPWWLMMLGAQSARLEHCYAWFAPAWHQDFPWQPLMGLAAMTHGSVGPVRNGMAGITMEAWVVLVPSMLLVGHGLHQRSRWHLPSMAGVIAVAGLCHMGVVFLFSILKTPIYVVSRADTPVAPLFILLLGAGLGMLAGKMAALVAVGLHAMVVLPLSATILVDTRSQERTLAQFLATNMAPGDAIITMGPFVDCTELYLGRARADVHQDVFPSSRRTSPFHGTADANNPALLELDAKRLAGEQRAGLQHRNGQRVWVLSQPGAEQDAVLKAFLEQFRVDGVLPLHYLDLVLHRFAPQTKTAP